MSMLGLKVGTTSAVVMAPDVEEARQDVVAVGRHHEVVDRQAHALGGVAGIDVAEIAGRHGEGDRPLRRAELQGGPEVIDDLRHHAREVDRVHRRQRVAVAEGEIVEAGLGEVLAVVERAVDGDVVHVGRQHRRHLAALDLAHAAARMQHEDVDGLAVAHRLDGGRAGVARGGADDRGALAAGAQRMVEHAPQELQRHVLEGERRAVEQLEQVQHPLVAQRLERRHFRRLERGVGFADQAAEGRLVEGIADEGLHDAKGQLAIGAGP